MVRDRSRKKVLVNKAKAGGSVDWEALFSRYGIESKDIVSANKLLANLWRELVKNRIKETVN